MLDEEYLKHSLFFFLLSVIFLFTDEFFRGETLISVLPERNDVVLSLHRIRQALQKPRKSAYFQIEFNPVERANYSSACSWTMATGESTVSKATSPHTQKRNEIRFLSLRM